MMNNRNKQSFVNVMFCTKEAKLVSANEAQCIICKVFLRCWRRRDLHAEYISQQTRLVGSGSTCVTGDEV